MTSHADVASAWVYHNTGVSKHDHLRGSRMFFQGPAIYSYGTRWELARFMRRGPRGEFYCLVNAGNRTRSTSTRRHGGEVSGALGRIFAGEVFVVNVIDDGGAAHADNAKAMLDAIERHLTRHRRARANRGLRIEWAAQGLRRLEDYCRFFQIEPPWPYLGVRLSIRTLTFAHKLTQ